MKLHEIAGSKSGTATEDITVDTEAYGEIDVTVKYYYEGASSSRHGDDASWDEHHGPVLDVISVKLAQDVFEQDDDGEPTDQVVKSGTSVEKLKYWNDDAAVEKELEKALDDGDDYVDDPRDYDY